MTKPKGIFKKRKNVGKPKIVIVNNTVGSPQVPNLQNEVPVSSSKKKLKSCVDMYENMQKEEDSDFVNVIVNISILKKAISEYLVCIKCHGHVSLSFKTYVGLATELVFSCDNCDNKCSSMNSELVTIYHDNKKLDLYDVNVRLVYGLRSIGKGQTAGNIFCGLMNLPKPPTKFNEYVNVIGSAVEDVCKQSMKDAIEEAVECNLEDNKRDLAIAVDGTYQKRGFRSLIGITTATSVDTGKVVDISIKNKFCRCPNKTKNVHEECCVANYYGVSGGMEVEGARDIFRRSQIFYGVKYTKFLGDGDTKSYKAVLEDKPYGENVTIEKLECIGHVQKRMGTRLMKLKTELHGKILSDGKKMSGQGRVTESNIKDIQKYYGLAIRRNRGNLLEMKKSVWATYFHLLSCNENPQHGLCSLSWCKFQKAKELNKNYNHSDHFHLPEASMTEMKSVFRDLAHPELLKKCLHGGTQNTNESLHNVIWTRLPKNVFVGMNTLHMGVFDAVASFHEGNIVKCQVLKNLGIKSGVNCILAMKHLDVIRINRAEKAVQEIYKQARQSSNKAKTLQKNPNLFLRS